MKIFSLVLSSLILAGSALAEEVTRTDKTSNTIPVIVGLCSVNKKIDPVTQKEVYESTLPVTNCQEYVTYQATVSGKSWNKKITPIAGTEKYSYKLEDDTQIGAGYSAEDILGYFNSLNACNEKRTLLVKLAEARKGQTKCSLSL